VVAVAVVYLNSRHIAPDVISQFLLLITDLLLVKADRLHVPNKIHFLIPNPLPHPTKRANSFRGLHGLIPSFHEFYTERKVLVAQ